MKVRNGKHFAFALSLKLEAFTYKSVHHPTTCAVFFRHPTSLAVARNTFTATIRESLCEAYSRLLLGLGAGSAVGEDGDGVPELDGVGVPLAEEVKRLGSVFVVRTGTM